jgi:hypothetical protein
MQNHPSLLRERTQSEDDAAGAVINVKEKSFTRQIHHAANPCGVVAFLLTLDADLH